MKSKIVYGRVNRYFIDGKEVTKKEFDRHFPTKIKDVLASGILDGHARTGWPVVSEAMAVPPAQVGKANEIAKRHGINVKYDPKTGNAVIPDQAARRRLMKHNGFFDKDAFN